MKLQVELVSQEFIKPNSPTPENLRLYELSLLDQISANVYNPVVYFFASNGTNPIRKSNQVKESLSDILTHYYPFAGRIIDNKFIDCNDEGVPYLVASVMCKLNDVVDNPVPGELNKLVPFELDCPSDLALGIQVNVFECGGIAIGACISHKIADGLSASSFINSWAASSHGQADLVRTQFISATLFPPKNNLHGYDPNVYVTYKNIITKMFMFDASAIEALKAKYAATSIFGTSLGSRKSPTRVEALSTFIWSRFLAVTPGDHFESDEPRGFCALLHCVNLRSRMEPPLPGYSFGNYFGDALTIVPIPSANNSSEVVYYNLMRKVMEQTKKFDKEYISKIREGGHEYLNFLKDSSNRILQGEMTWFDFTSLCRFPFYDADFGWGKPIWVGMPAWPYKNLVIFVDTKSGGGIEAYVSLKEEDMAKLENDKELPVYVSPTGSKHVRSLL
ncbi:Vinorine synthase-like [Quillaja saponaria]|uniref:Vinorine synthase-like n=1 Tax=Quillaja saponaria TaxID=32244 RepID=A0AAD7LRU1_QUISA|nr:Vinorine synthase-like [Quillaja saponaria]